MNIPRSAIPYILFQRTNYLHLSLLRPIQKLPYRWRVGMESLVRSSSIKRLYEKDILDEYKTISPHLPDNPGAVMDIGSGMAGIEILLFDHYKKRSHSPEMWLVDRGMETSEIYYDFNLQGAAYNSFAQTQKFLVLNGVPPKNIHVVDIDKESLPSRKFGLILSLISMGYHYPIDSYLNFIVNHLSKDGKSLLTCGKEAAAKKS